MAVEDLLLGEWLVMDDDQLKYKPASPEDHYPPSPDDAMIIHSNNNYNNVSPDDPCPHHQGAHQKWGQCIYYGPSTMQQQGPLTFDFNPNNNNTEFEAKDPQSELLC